MVKEKQKFSNQRRSPERGSFRGQRPNLSKEEKTKMVEERIKQQQATHLEGWKPKTELGHLVKNKKITTLDEALKYRILEPEIIDTLSKWESEILNIGQAKGKFGGGKRRAWRQTQKKTSEGNVPTFSCMVIVGNGQGYFGLGYGRAKETLPARAKAMRNAKLNIMKINRGCGSFDCTCGETHSVPFIVQGKTGSCDVRLMPAPQGTGLVIGDECKKILRMAGIKDVYSFTRGKRRTTINFAKACVEALKQTREK